VLFDRGDVGPMRAHASSSASITSPKWGRPLVPSDSGATLVCRARMSVMTLPVAISKAANRSHLPLRS